MKELIVFSHNDLDMFGCKLSIEFRMPDIAKKYFYTNYANIPKQVDDILEYAEANGNTSILIPDVSFSDNKESLIRLYDYFEKITVIDHHLYPDGFWDAFPKMKVVHDKTKCASKLCHEFFGNAGKNNNLDKLIHIIDIYDLWQSDNIAFNFSQDLNQYFWTYDPALLAQKVKDNDYKLPDDFKPTIKALKEKAAADIKIYEETNKIHRARGISFLFINEWFNEVLIKEMDQGQNFVIGINSYGITRVRINVDADVTEDQKNKLRFDLTGTNDIGHMNAFTYRIKDFKDFNSILAEAQKIDNLLQEIL